MKISSIIDIIDGELLSSPSISFVYNIKVNSKKIVEGDLFITKNPNDIEEAIANGAFAIIYDFDDIKQRVDNAPSLNSDAKAKYKEVINFNGDNDFWK